MTILQKPKVMDLSNLVKNSKQLSCRNAQATKKKKKKKKNDTERQFKELRDKINKQKKILYKRFKSKRELIDIQELKDMINETKNTREHTGNRADHLEERISTLKIEI